VTPLFDPDEEARDALRARQGAGARYDAPVAPHDQLLLARRGAAFFARVLNELTDRELDAPSACDGLSRRHVVSEVSLSARAMAIAIKSVRGGLSEDEEAWQPNMPMTVTLPARALRFLYTHSDIHLNVEFRDLSSSQWDMSVDLNGPTPLYDLPMKRARALWFGARDLNAGALLSALPEPFRQERAP
jgi:maleylpyruvate isomerase